MAIKNLPKLPVRDIRSVMSLKIKVINEDKRREKKIQDKKRREKRKQEKRKMITTQFLLAGLGQPMAVLLFVHLIHSHDVWERAVLNFNMGGRDGEGRGGREEERDTKRR